MIIYLYSLLVTHPVVFCIFIHTLKAVRLASQEKDLSALPQHGQKLTSEGPFIIFTQYYIWHVVQSYQ